MAAMAGSILAVGLWLCLAPAAGECAAKLEMSSLTGPAQCTPDGAKQIPDAQFRAKAQCFQECASSYQIAAADGANMAVAKPQTTTCTKEDAGLTVACSSVPLKCAKPFADFPNSCSGVVPLDPGVEAYVAFYSYCNLVAQTTTVSEIFVFLAWD